jgi:hypothetical protein
MFYAMNSTLVGKAKLLKLKDPFGRFIHFDSDGLYAIVCARYFKHDLYC